MPLDDAPAPSGAASISRCSPVSGLRPGETVIVHVIKRLDAGQVGSRRPGQGLSRPPRSCRWSRAPSCGRGSAGPPGRLVLTVSDVVPDARARRRSQRRASRRAASRSSSRGPSPAQVCPSCRKPSSKVKTLLTRAGVDDRKVRALGRHPGGQADRPVEPGRRVAPPGPRLRAEGRGGPASVPRAAAARDAARP